MTGPSLQQVMRQAQAFIESRRPAERDVRDVHDLTDAELEAILHAKYSTEDIAALAAWQAGGPLPTTEGALELVTIAFQVREEI